MDGQSQSITRIAAKNYLSHWCIQSTLNEPVIVEFSQCLNKSVYNAQFYFIYI